MFVAVVAGIVTALAAPPIYLLPAAFFGLPVLVWLLDGVRAQADSRRERASGAFFTGWAFGFGYFAPNLYWVSEAFLVDGDVFGWMIPFVIILFPLGLGLFYGFAGALASVFWSTGPTRIFALAASFTAMEWLRGHILTGFPWATMGYAAGALEGLEQAAASVSVYGLTFIICLLCSSPAILADNTEDKLHSKTERLGVFALIVGIAFALWAGGTIRLNRTP